MDVVVVNFLLWEISNTPLKPKFPSLIYSHDQLLVDVVSYVLHPLHPYLQKKKKKMKKMKKKKINVEHIPANYHIISFINISVGSSKR